MRNRTFIVLLVLIAFSTGLWAGGKTEAPSKPAPAGPQAFSWKQYSGAEIQFLANNNPVGQLLEKYAKEFTDLTGIKVTVSLFAEQQFRQRLQTIFQAKSDEVDLYMSLVSREGQLFQKAGWYLDLNPLLNDKTATSPDYNFADFGKGRGERRRPLRSPDRNSRQHRGAGLLLQGRHPLFPGG